MSQQQLDYVATIEALMAQQAGMTAWEYYVASGSCEGNVTVPAED